MKKFAVCMLVAMIVVLGSINAAFAIHAGALIPSNGQKPIWSELCSNQQYTVYYLNNPTIRKLDEREKDQLALLKYVYRTATKIGKKTFAAGFYEHRLIWITNNNTKWFVMGIDAYDKNGNLMASIDDKEMQKLGVPSNSVANDDPIGILLNDFHY